MGAEGVRLGQGVVGGGLYGPRGWGGWMGRMGLGRSEDHGRGVVGGPEPEWMAGSGCVGGGGVEGGGGAWGGTGQGPALAGTWAVGRGA